jgi:hypothetical protein
MQLWKHRGTTNSLSHVERRERDLIAHVERGIDEGIRHGGLIEEIVTECRARILIQPDDASWRFLLGRFLMATGQPADARDELEAAAMLNPRDPRVSAHLALWYEAAFLAASSGRSTVELPSGAGPEITVDVRAFGDLDEVLPAATLASRVMQLVDATLKFSLRGADQRMLKTHRASVIPAPVEAPAATPLNIVPLSRAG